MRRARDGGGIGRAEGSLFNRSTNKNNDGFHLKEKHREGCDISPKKYEVADGSGAARNQQMNNLHMFYFLSATGPIRAAKSRWR